MKMKIFTLLQGSPVACRKNKTRTTYLSDKPEVVVTLASVSVGGRRGGSRVPWVCQFTKITQSQKWSLLSEEGEKKSSGLPMNRFPHCLQTITKAHSHTVSNHNYSL